jgi:hypothetical protein
VPFFDATRITGPGDQHHKSTPDAFAADLGLARCIDWTRAAFLFLSSKYYLFIEKAPVVDPIIQWPLILLRSSDIIPL